MPSKKLRKLTDNYFKKELATFKKNLPKMLKQCDKGAYAVILDNLIDYPFKDFGAAIDFGYKNYGLRKFMVKEITDKEKIHYI